MYYSTIVNSYIIEIKLIEMENSNSCYYKITTCMVLIDIQFLKDIQHTHIIFILLYICCILCTKFGLGGGVYDPHIHFIPPP